MHDQGRHSKLFFISSESVSALKGKNLLPLYIPFNKGFLRKGLVCKNANNSPKFLLINMQTQIKLVKSLKRLL